MKIKKLWLLRLYMSFLEYISMFILTSYAICSIYFWLSKEVNNSIAEEVKNSIAALFIGLSGIYTVIIALLLLFASQIVQMFIHTHDNIIDIRNKTLMPELGINHFPKGFENEEYKGSERIKNIAIAALISIAVIILLINFYSIKYM